MTYISRVLKYIVKLALLSGVLLAAMIFTKTTYVEPAQLMAGFFSSTRGVLLIAALLAIALTYPFFGFVRRDVAGSFDGNSDAVVNAMAAGGYKLVSTDGGVMTFRAEGALRRALALWDDAVKVCGDNRFITLEGSRREVSRAEFRLRSFINRKAQ